MLLRRGELRRGGNGDREKNWWVISAGWAARMHGAFPNAQRMLVPPPAPLLPPLLLRVLAFAATADAPGLGRRAERERGIRYRVVG